MTHQPALYESSKGISILLVEPENPDNIGAVARAMKNMGLYDLCVVKPPKAWRNKARKMAVSAADVLKRARVYRSVKKAVEPAAFVVGTTRRGGPHRGYFVPFAKTLSQAVQKADVSRVIIMFGKESKGLDNESLGFCDWVTTIPVDEGYPSINLAQAVMIVAFNLFDRRQKNADIRQYCRTSEQPRRGQRQAIKKPSKKSDQIYLNKEQIFGLLERLEEALIVLNYDKKQNNILSRIQKTFHGLIKRNGILSSEAQMIRGLCRRITEKVVHNKSW